MRSLIGIGFWYSFSSKNFPDPGKFQKDVSESERNNLVSYLSNGIPCAQFLSDDWCRFRCLVEDSILGKSYLTDGIYVWPSSLIHYVSEHNVYLPDEFIIHLNSDNQDINLDEYNIDTKWWEKQSGFGGDGKTYIYPSDEIESTLKNRKFN